METLRSFETHSELYPCEFDSYLSNTVPSLGNKLPCCLLRQTSYCLNLVHLRRCDSMANSCPTSGESIFKGGPSIQQMQQDKKYRQTLNAYRGAIKDGMMILPEDLEGYPAPVLCPYCEVPIITRTKTERNGKQKYIPNLL